MTKPVRFTKATMRRAVEVACERQVRVVIRPDGSIMFDPKPVDTDSPADEKWSDVQA